MRKESRNTCFAETRAHAAQAPTAQIGRHALPHLSSRGVPRGATLVDAPTVCAQNQVSLFNCNGSHLRTLR